MTDRTAGNSQRAYARLAGLMYLVVLAFDVGGVVMLSSIAGSGNFIETSHRIIASELLYRVGLCLSLVGSLSTILLAIGLYVTVRPVDGNLAMTALLFRVVEVATGAAGIMIGFAALQINLAVNHANAFDANQLGALANLSGVGPEVGAIFFSVGSTIFFYIFLTSNYIPRLMSAWGIFGSLVYLAYWFASLIVPHYSSAIAVYGSVPILIAELSTGLWLLIAGIKVQPAHTS